MSDFVTLTCPSCGAKVNVAEDTGRFQCAYCGNEHILKLSVEPVAPAKPRRRLAVPTPASVVIEKDHESARLIQRWFSLKYIGLLFFVIPWDTFLCVWYSMAFRSEELGYGFPWTFFIFPLGHLAVGVCFTYAVLAGMLNRTVVELTREELSVWFEPLPWLGECTIKTSDIKQIYCKQVGSSQRNNGPVKYNHELYVVTRDFKQRKLLGDIDAPDVAIFFEQQLETWMRIPDQPVLGEINKNY